MSEGKIEFVCYIPDLKSAFQADVDEVRVMLSIPKIYRSQAMRMADMFEKQLKVTVEEY